MSQLRAKRSITTILKRVEVDMRRRQPMVSERLINTAVLPMTIVFNYDGGIFATKTSSPIQLQIQKFDLNTTETFGTYKFH